MKFVLLLLNFMFVLSIGVSATASVGTRGGGTIDSRKIDDLVVMLGKDEHGRTPIKEDLIRYVRQIVALPPPTKMGRQIVKMAKHGLIEDIEKAVYELRASCYVDRKEKAASTLRTNLYKVKPGEPRLHPAVCINVPLLVREDATKAQIVGVLMHEHSRHFGYEDTDYLGRHPSALAMEKMFATLDFYSGVSKPGVNTRLLHSHNSMPYLFLAVANPKDLEVSLFNFEGECTEAKMLLIPQMVEFIAKQGEEMGARVYFHADRDVVVLTAPGCRGKIEVRYQDVLVESFEMESFERVTVNVRQPKECVAGSMGDHCY